MQVDIEDLIQRLGPDAVKAMIHKVKGIDPPRVDKPKHYCLSCKSSNIYRLERPIKWMDKKMTKMRCKVCKFKWTRYEYQGLG